MRRSGLGRGLGALIPPAEATSPAESGSLREIPLAHIRPNQFQPRKEFDEEALSSLVDSIRVVGVLQPVLVREVADGEYELIAGERRCRAARRAGLQSVPALVQRVTDASSLEQALIENLHREDLNALDEAAAYKQLIEDFDLTHEEVAQRVGRSRVAVTNALRLFQLPPSVQRQLRDRSLSAGHARALLGTPDRELQELLAARAVEQGLSVRALEEAVRTALRARQEDGWDTAWSEPAVAAPSEAPPLGDGSTNYLDDPPGDGTAPAPSAVQREDEGSTPLPGGGATGRLAGAPADGNGPASGIPGAGRAGSALARGTLTTLPGTSPGTSPGTLPGGQPDRRPAAVLELEELLADYLDTRVRVELGARHGRVVVEFATVEDLERIFRLMIAEGSTNS